MKAPLVIVAVALLGAMGCQSAPALRISHLTCEHRVDPLGIDRPRPALAWRIDAPSSQQVTRQTAYRVLVSAGPELLQRGIGEMWDSGKVKSPDSFDVLYSGAELHA